MSPRRRGRGVDFEHRYKASKWAEDRLLEAFHRTMFECVRLGISGYSADNTIATAAGQPKVPDLLVVDKTHLTPHQLELVSSLDHDLREVEEARLHDGGDLAFLLANAVCAIEVEFSPYRAKEMTGRQWQPRTVEVFDRRPLRTAKPPTAPNIFVKEEDVDPLNEWSAQARIPIVVMHVFDQEVFAYDLASLVEWRLRYQADPSQLPRLCHTTGIFRQNMNYNRTDAQGASETKVVYMISPAAARFAGEAKNVKVVAQLDLSSSKKYVASVKFDGGDIVLEPAFVAWLQTLRRESRTRSQIV